MSIYLIITAVLKYIQTQIEFGYNPKTGAWN